MPVTELTHPARTFVETTSFAEFSEDLTGTDRLMPPVTSTIVRTERIRIQARGQIVNFRIDRTEPPPIWVQQVLQGFANLITLPDNWDGEGSRRIDVAAANRALAAIDQLLPRNASAPSIVPIADSGLQIEWHRKEQDLEVEFGPQGQTDFYYFNHATGEESEGSVGPNFAQLRKYLARIW
jgi:hypothetical protein